MLLRLVPVFFHTTPWANQRTSGDELVGTSNKSECTLGLEMRGGCLAFSHSARGDGETDSARFGVLIVNLSHDPLGPLNRSLRPSPLRALSSTI
jgi:hypothetical protein